ncbi:MAG: penicillin-binding protein [Terriglobia bacterium]
MSRPEIADFRSSAKGPLLLHRTFILAAAFVVWMLLIFARLYYLQIIEYTHWLDRAENQQQRTIPLAPQRGTIYDARMHPLAMSLPVDSIYAVPSHLADRHNAAYNLASILRLDPRDLENRFATFKMFCWVKRKVSAAESAKIKSLHLRGIYFQKEMKRFYPMQDLAANVLGYVGMDDRGLAGLEYSLNAEIKGAPGRAMVMEDARRETFESKDHPGRPGMDVKLTIDSGIQYIAQRVLDADVSKWHAEGGVVIVQVPRTGAILAMASYPTFNPNEYERSSAADRQDRAVSWIYEPGSTFKMITLSSAIQDGLARPTNLIDCQMGAIVLGGRTIHDDPGVIPHDRAGPLTLSQVLAYSSDVGAVKTALRLGENRFYRDIRAFGFGERTGVGLPSEERGLLMPPDEWSGVSIGEIAIGQGIGITPIQLVDAYSAVANGGTLMQPRVVNEVFGAGTREWFPARPIRQVLSSQTAAEMRRMLEGVVAFGTGTTAQLDGYSAAGKTGTAEKVGPDGRYSHTHEVASFIGFTPVSHPAVTILVVIDTPVGAIYGTEVAAPAWKEIAQQTLSYLGVPHDEPVTPTGPSQEIAENKGGGAQTANLPPASAAPDPPGPQPRSGLAEGAKGVAVLEDGPTITVPDFSGLDQRSVADECAALGLNLTVRGSGLAIEQNPAAGSKAPEGSGVQVVFAR